MIHRNSLFRTVVRFVLLGVVLNILCCWYLVGVVTFQDSGMRPIMGEDINDPWSVKRYDSRGGMLVSAVLNQSTYSQDEIVFSETQLPGWCSLKTVPAYQAGDLMPKVHEFAYGWPMLGLSMSYHSHHGIKFGAIVREEFQGALPGVEFPARVIPAGFAVNTSVFALASWLIVSPCLFVRSRLRRRKGLCPDCAHELGGALLDGCPKCGKPILAPLSDATTA